MYNKKLKDLKSTHDKLVKLLPKNGSPRNPLQCPALVRFYRAITIEKDIFTNKLSNWRMSCSCKSVFNVTPNELGWEHIHDFEYDCRFHPDEPSIYGKDQIGVGGTEWPIENDFSDFTCAMLAKDWDGNLERPDYSNISSVLAPVMREIIEDAAREQNIKLPSPAKDRYIN